MFENFTKKNLHANGVQINTLIGGSGPPLLLLHGYPQSHLIWHRVAPELAKHYTVVATDLRGYGHSEKPPGLADHSNYSKREMAKDQVEVMRQLGFDGFYLCGHDRGARVSHRLAVDHPDAVKRMMLLDISPTLAMYEQTTMDFARSYWCDPVNFPLRV
jgi:haloacetate dehalogenase